MWDVFRWLLLGCVVGDMVRLERESGEDGSGEEGWGGGREERCL